MLDERIAALQEEIVESVCAAVRVRSVQSEPSPGKPFGAGVHEALTHCLTLAQNLGFKTVNVDNMLGYAEYGQGEEMVAVLGHLDVVPEGNGWSFPPYGGVVQDGKIYGRGATDNKGPTIGALYALKAIKDLQLPLKRRVRVIFGLNEENGSACVKHYVAAGGQIPVCGFTPDAAYPIINGEKGIVTCEYRRALAQTGELLLLSINAGTAANVVPDLAEAVLAAPAPKIAQILALAAQTADIEAEQQGGEVKITAHGLSAHGSEPEKGQNAAALLLLFLRQLGFSGDMAEFLRFFHDHIGLDVNGRKLGVFSEDDISGLFIFNLGVVRGDSGSISLEMNMRYPVTHSYEDFIGVFQDKMRLGQLAEISLRHKKALYVPPEREFIKKLQQVYEEKTGDKADLISIGGGTYAKNLDNIVAFGPIFRGQPWVEHKPDEYIKIDELIKNVQIMAAAICALAN